MNVDHVSTGFELSIKKKLLKFIFLRDLCSARKLNL